MDQDTPQCSVLGRIRVQLSCRLTHNWQLTSEWNLNIDNHCHHAETLFHTKCYICNATLYRTTCTKRCVKLCKVVYYMNHTTQLCGSYSTQLYTTLHNGFAVYKLI